MSLAGPTAEVVPVWLIFLVAGGVCPIVAVAAMMVARMRDDELAHPLDRVVDRGADRGTAQVGK